MAEDNKILNNLQDNAGTYAGLAQTLYGLIASSQNEAPKSNVSNQLKNLSREVRQRAAYGLNPGEKTIAENNIKNIQQNELDLIKNLSGGSVDVALSNIAMSTKRTHDALSSIAIKDAKLKEDKTLAADQILLKAIESDERDYNRRYNKYLTNEQAIANLISSGISNIVGQSKLNKTEEELSKDQNDNTSVLSSLIKSNEKVDKGIETTGSIDESKDIDPAVLINSPVKFEGKNIIGS